MDHVQVMAAAGGVPIKRKMLVYSQNGERLRPQQGYPLRLLLPGFECNMSVKSLRRLRVAAELTYSREDTSKIRHARRAVEKSAGVAAHRGNPKDSEGCSVLREKRRTARLP
jgi:DMSO/TMAO reductase YedYZ molybdopterin-dependent catalytic subunit